MACLAFATDGCVMHCFVLSMRDALGLGVGIFRSVDVDRTLNRSRAQLRWHPTIDGEWRNR